MSKDVYLMIHLVGIATVWMALGASTVHAMNGGTRVSNPSRRLVAATHGLGLVLILLGGFGMLAKMGMTSGMPGWAAAKFVLWLVVGAILALPMRIPALAKPIWFALPLLVGLAAWLALAKPF